jgi:hypothetical protein
METDKELQYFFLIFRFVISYHDKQTTDAVLFCAAATPSSPWIVTHVGYRIVWCAWRVVAKILV